jgi:uncharacterized protein YndB with AHSA1/START domain
MARTTRTLTASPAEVFAVLADGWLYPGWVVGASRMRAVDPAWPAPHAKLHHSFGTWPALLDDETEMLEWEPDRRVLMEARGWPMGTALVELTVTETETGCEVTIDETPHRGPGVLIAGPVQGLVIGYRNTETLRRLAYLAEGGARGAYLAADPV